MNIAVLLRPVPDPVEELELNADSTDLDRDFLGHVLNEFDDHALEEALLLTEEVGGTVTVFAPGSAVEVDLMLFTALAKGAHSARKLGDGLDALDSHGLAELFASQLAGFDLVLCGVQAPDELDGQVSALVAVALGLPHISVVTGTAPSDDGLAVTKEFWGGLTAEYRVGLPAVLGVQAARQAPRYVAVSRIRQAQGSGGLEELDVDAPGSSSGVTITALRVPESGGHADMIDGDETVAAQRIIEIIRRAGIAQGA